MCKFLGRVSVAAVSLCALACGGSATTVAPSGPVAPIGTLPVPQEPAAIATGGRFNHVVVVVEENENHDDIIGNAQMPYLNSLAAQYSLATEYYANTHPSIGNYFMLTVGRVVSNSSEYSAVVSDDNVVRRLVAGGRTWKSYAEDLPAVGYTGGDTGLYARRHNVFALLSDVVRSATEVRNLVPFHEFPQDLAANALPNYSFIVPNLCNDGHDCPLSTVDAWLQANMAPLVGSSQFQRDGLLVILFDEASDADRTNGGGRVAWVAVSARAKRGYRSTTFYQHQSTLRLTLEALGLTSFPNLAATAPDMNEFFIF
jgi:phosphatidylinositol-3-phosphatase